MNTCISHSGIASTSRARHGTNAELPVRVGEIAGVLGISRQAVLKRANRGEFGPMAVDGLRVYRLSGFADGTLAERLRARRRVEARAIAQAIVTDTPEIHRFPIELSEFTDEEQALGAERRDFLIEVERMRLDQPSLTYGDCIERIEHRERMAAHRHDNSLRYRRLFIGGQRWGCQLTLKNFERYKAWWSKWRSGPFDTANWWCLCDTYRWNKITEPDGTIRYVTKTEDRAGDAQFWALFAAFYESPVKRSRVQAYELAVKGALQAGVKPEHLPTLRQVAYHYQAKVSPQLIERARFGEKYHYDTLSVEVIRNHRKTRPNLCWSGDHHMLNLFVRVFDETAGGWRVERPWLTDWIDVSSWYTVGWHISIQPSRDTIELALQGGIGAVQGVPRYLYFDNGKDYQAFSQGGRLGYDQDRALGICELLGTRPIFALPHNPRAKLNERNYCVMFRFENLFTSFSGRNKQHMEALWDARREDGFTLRERLERYPKTHTLAGCLVRPELVPTLAEVRAAFAKWLAEQRHQMVSRGRVCPGQSPEQRYRAPIDPSLLRAVSAEETARAFLRVHRMPIKVKRNGTFEWTPPGGTIEHKMFFVDEALRRLAGERIQVRYDLNVYPPRVFAFERYEHGEEIAGEAAEKRLTWKLVACSGPAKSVPNIDLADAIAEGEDAHQKLRDLLARAKRIGRDSKRGHDADTLRAGRDLLARELGMDRAQLVYDLKPAAAREAVKAHDARRSGLRRIFAGVPESEAEIWLNGGSDNERS